MISVVQDGLPFFACPCEQANSQMEISPPFFDPESSHGLCSYLRLLLISSHHPIFSKQKLQDSVDFLPPPCAVVRRCAGGTPRQFRPTAHLGSEGQGARCLGDIALGLEQKKPWMVTVVHHLSCCFKTPTSGFKHV